MIAAYSNTDTNFDWVVEVDGIIVARYSRIRYGANAAFYAARDANERRNNDAAV